MNPAPGHKEVSKRFFFEKKNQKTFAHAAAAESTQVSPRRAATENAGPRMRYGESEAGAARRPAWLSRTGAEPALMAGEHRKRRKPRRMTARAHSLFRLTLQL
jgi:hypothetical protein